MSGKKVSYKSLLKEAIQEFDTSGHVDVKGPMLDPILGYDGGGELPTHKDAASVLERYYFNQEQDKGVTVDEHVDNVMDEEPGAKDGTSKDSDVVSQKKDIEKAVTEQDDNDTDEPEEEVVEAEEMKADEPEEEDVSEAEQVENAVIEKLIGEMEAEVGNDPEKEEEDLEENRVPGDRGVGGEEAMGTSDSEKQVPDRKDATNEAEEVDTPEEAEEDIDAKVKSEGAGPDAGVGGGPLSKGKKGGEDEEDIEEAFRLFREEIEKDEEDIDPDKVQA